MFYCILFCVAIYFCFLSMVGLSGRPSGEEARELLCCSDRRRMETQNADWGWINEKAIFSAIIYTWRWALWSKSTTGWVKRMINTLILIIYGNNIFTGSQLRLTWEKTWIWNTLLIAHSYFLLNTLSPRGLRFFQNFFFYLQFWIWIYCKNMRKTESGISKESFSFSKTSN